MRMYDAIFDNQASTEEDWQPVYKWKPWKSEGFSNIYFQTTNCSVNKERLIEVVGRENNI